MTFAQWLNDIRWANNMKRARKFRRELGPEARMAYDAAARFHQHLYIWNFSIEDHLAGMSAAYAIEPPLTTEMDSLLNGLFS